MIPTRAPYSGQAYRLFTDYNDVQVFIEDAGFENLYREIFRCNGVKIRKVFSKNGKEAILEAARACNDKQCVFIVDRDWDDVLGISYALKNLVVLKKHSIENYLLDYSGFYAIVVADNPREDIEIIFSRSIFDSIVNDVSHRLRPLFECFLSMQIAGDSRKGCSYMPGKYQEASRACTPDVNIIACFVAQIGIPVPQAVCDYFMGDVLKDRGHGKYMLHYVWNGVRQSTGTGQLGIEKLMVRLAQVIDSDDLKELCEQVLSKGRRRS
jgi:hypothetical protein